MHACGRIYQRTTRVANHEGGQNSSLLNINFYNSFELCVWFGEIKNIHFHIQKTGWFPRRVYVCRWSLSAEGGSSLSGFQPDFRRRPDRSLVQQAIKTFSRLRDRATAVYTKSYTGKFQLLKDSILRTIVHAYFVGHILQRASTIYKIWVNKLKSPNVL